MYKHSLVGPIGLRFLDTDKGTGKTNPVVQLKIVTSKFGSQNVRSKNYTLYVY